MCCVLNGSCEFNSSSCCQDDPPAMDFVTAAANLRMHIFSMNMKSRFDVKCKSAGSHLFKIKLLHWNETVMFELALFYLMIM